MAPEVEPRVKSGAGEPTAGMGIGVLAVTGREGNGRTGKGNGDRKSRSPFPVSLFTSHLMPSRSRFPTSVQFTTFHHAAT